MFISHENSDRTTFSHVTGPGESNFSRIRGIITVMHSGHVTSEPPSRFWPMKSFAFRDCRRLRRIEIPSAVSSIRIGCFANSSISRCTFESPPALTRIGSWQQSQIRNFTAAGILCFSLRLAWGLVELHQNPESENPACCRDCSAMMPFRIEKTGLARCCRLPALELPSDLSLVTLQACGNYSEIQCVTSEGRSSIESFGDGALEEYPALREICIRRSVEIIQTGLVRVEFESQSKLNPIEHHTFRVCTFGFPGRWRHSKTWHSAVAHRMRSNLSADRI
jgi:hypothetical protein